MFPLKTTERLARALLSSLLILGGCGDDGGTLDGSVDSGSSPDGAPTDTGTGDGGPTDGAVDSGRDGGGPPPSAGRVPRGGDFMGDTERFNRHYTDPGYTPSNTIYVSPTGSGAGTMTDPTSPDDAFGRVGAGQEIRFLAGDYNGCWELDGEHSGTYDAPIVIRADRASDGSRGVHVQCCTTGRQSCFNLEGADYVAIDGFVLEGGNYGVRTVGLGYAGSDHQVGVAIIDNEGFDQNRDPFFSGQSDWIAVDANVAHGAGSGDGHGIYLSNGSDWMIVRGNDLYDNASSDFQINADPLSTCEDVGIAFDAPACDGSARGGLGQGVSEFVLVENNYFHNGASSGPNFTSVRNSVIRNNIIGFYQRHGTSFWQETDNPNLGSSDNIIQHNLFIGEESGRHILQFSRYSDRNDVRNNVLLGISMSGTSAMADPGVVLLELDTATTTANVFEGNYYSGGSFDGHSPTASEVVNAAFESSWFEDFPFDRMGSPASMRPSSAAPFLDAASPTTDTPHDREGTPRATPTDLGPYERG